VKVRLLSHRPMTGRYNMAVDEAIHNAYQRGESGPTLRFYRWKPACLSVGRFQSVERQVDLESLKQLGIDLVRRPSGGRAVLHDDELTYSLVISEGLLPGSVLETYRILSQALVDGLRALGIPARLSELERGVTARDPRFKGAACFSAPSWYEIEACGKKITGSAQFRKDGVILQHGSIPLSMDYSKLARCFKTRSPAHAKRLESMLPGKAAGLTEVCGRQVSACELQQELVRAFENAFDWKLEKGSLTTGEIREAVKLSQGKYGAVHWTMERATAR
jgi:lipoate-protein ligase A